MSKSPVNIWAIHGFLGLPSDWEGYDVRAVEVGTATTFKEWARAFNERVASEQKPGKNYIMGYSMGGRLALYAMQENPELWESGIIISAHTGLESGKEERLASDEVWAQRFENDPWYQVVADWMAQPSFQGSRGPLRVESDFNRKDLASQLRNFSLGRQEILHNDRAVFVIGERDERYRKFQPNALVVPNSGHRVLFDNPTYLKLLIEEQCQ